MNYGRAGLDWMLSLGREVRQTVADAVKPIPSSEQIDTLEKRVEKLERQVEELLSRPRRPFVDIRMSSVNDSAKQSALDKFSKGLLP